ncbi:MULTISPECIES: alpha/beta hydrolase family protein [Nocardia]|uniref:alpha/beta hydrolase family protein n=1 Tax=Nocardia TaxID=1817 RepID=UPI0007A40F0B|nr:MULTISPECIES: alpha/beta fold hydrolase [Nocardia]
MVSRLIAATVAAVALLGTGAGWARGNPIAFRPSPIAAPAGAHPVGRIDTALTDPDRDRTIVVSVWYPALEVGSPAAYVPAAGSAAQARIAAVSASWMHATAAAVRMVGAKAAATQGAPVAGDRLPVVVASPGMGTPRWILSGLATDLASRGYVVVVIDHTGESPAVQFPDGRIILGTPPTTDTDYMRRQLHARTADLRLMLDRLAVLPIVGAHLDLGRIAALGHSYGGTTAVQLAAADSRVRAVVALDAPAGWDGVADAPTLDLPVLSLDLTGVWASSWNEFRGNRFEVVSMRNAGHYTATDLPAFGCGADLCGTVPSDRAAIVSRGVVGSWLDRWLRGMDSPKFTAPELKGRT